MAKLDRNGYSLSILNSVDGVCYLCGEQTADTIRHECFPGGGNRGICKREGLWVSICPLHHQIVHENEAYAEKVLKRPCQEAYLKNHTRAEWYRLIGRFYDE